MKKTLFLSVLVLLTLRGMSQEIQLNAYAGYFLGGRLNGYDADAVFAGGPDFGFGLSYGLGRGKNLEASYTFAASSAKLRRNSNGTYSDETNMTFGYIQIGYVQDIMLKNSKADLRPFLLITIGAAYLNPEDADYTTAWRFATALGGGLKYFITERIGIRIQARLLTPMYFGGSYYCGTCGSVSGFSTLAQGDFTGGIVVKLGEDK